MIKLKFGEYYVLKDGPPNLSLRIGLIGLCFAINLAGYALIDFQGCADQAQFPVETAFFRKATRKELAELLKRKW